MSNFTNDELKNLKACVDLFIKNQGAEAAKVLMPTYDKIEEMIVDEEEEEDESSEDEN